MRATVPVGGGRSPLALVWLTDRQEAKIFPLRIFLRSSLHRKRPGGEAVAPGAKEQHPHTWRDATASGIRRALRQAKAVAAEVQAIGVSGQQHGFVPLDQDGEVIRPAKLWCDTSTAAECEEIMAKLGGLKTTIRALGNAVLPGFTASKILWLKKHEPKNFARLATVLLPHDYLNYWLTGQKVMEYGDASGTALIEVKTRTWSEAALRAIDDGLLGKLPLLIPSDQPAGRLQPST